VTASEQVDLSVVIPAYDEQESLRELIPRIDDVVSSMDRRHEIIVIDDGSRDGTFAEVERLATERPHLRGISFSRNYGKAAALSAGFAAAQGAIVVTMDADLQDDPQEIPRLVAEIDSGRLDLVSGWKQNRQDSFVKNHSSRLFNLTTSLVAGLRLHDFNCGLKAYRREVTQAVRLYGEMHRYIPVLAHLEGYRVGELRVRHHARRFGRSKYGPARFLNGFLDLLTVVFLSSRATSPLHFFGRLGLLFLVVGGFINGYFFVDWLLGHGLHIRPLLLLGVALVLLAVQFVSLGLIAELIVAGRHPELEYRVRRRI
jgi:glycosyltransferase involved in cell wall biosynthesis